MPDVVWRFALLCSSEPKVASAPNTVGDIVFGGVKPLVVETEMGFTVEYEGKFTCQNSIPRGVANVLGKLYKDNPRMVVTADNPQLLFSMEYLKYDYRASTSSREPVLTRDILEDAMGGYASMVSPMVSPYFVRHIIDVLRMKRGESATLGSNGGPKESATLKRIEIIRRAADEGVELNTNLRETWGVDEKLDYGMFRTEPLWQSTSTTHVDETGFFANRGFQPKDWDLKVKLFPPRGLVEGAVI